MASACAASWVVAHTPCGPMAHGGARRARPEQILTHAMGEKGNSEGQFGSEMVKVALIKAIGKTVKGPALLETQPPPYGRRTLRASGSARPADAGGGEHVGMRWAARRAAGRSTNPLARRPASCALWRPRGTAGQRGLRGSPGPCSTAAIPYTLAAPCDPFYFPPRFPLRSRTVHAVLLPCGDV